MLKKNKIWYITCILEVSTMRFFSSKQNNIRVYTDESETIEFAREEEMDGKRIITVNDTNLETLSSEDVYTLFSKIYYIAAKDGVTPIVITAKSPVTMETKDILVKDIDPIKFDGEIDIENEMALYMCIEAPVRKACMALNQKGIQTLMSSANKNDVESRNQRIGIYRNFGGGSHFNLGNGYAWIMIDWESLSTENKKRLIMLNNGTVSIELSEQERKNLIHNCELNHIEVSQKELVSFLEVFDMNSYSLNGNSLLQLDTSTEEDSYFQQNRRGYACLNSLCNHGEDFRTVVLRCPLDEETTTSQVEEYFMMIIKFLEDQKDLNLVETK